MSAPMVEWDGAATVTFDIGEHVVVLRKMFGPLIFEDLRIRAEADTCQWVIERTITIDEGDGNEHEEWREVVRIEGQP